MAIKIYIPLKETEEEGVYEPTMTIGEEQFETMLKSVSDAQVEDGHLALTIKQDFHASLVPVGSLIRVGNKKWYKIVTRKGNND